MPPALEDEPMLDADLEPYLQAFAIMSPARTVSAGFGAMIPSGIGLAEIRAYVELYEVEDVERFVRFIRAIDAEFLAISAERANKSSK